MIGKRNHWMLVLSASAIFMITMGVRQSLGLFISPLNTATGLHRWLGKGMSAFGHKRKLTVTFKFVPNRS